MDPQRIGGDLEGGLGGEQLGHAGLHVDAFSGVGPAGGVVGHEAGGLELGGHLGEHELDGLVLEDRPAEGLALLRVGHRRLEGGLGHPDGPRRHVDAPEFQCREGVAATVADAVVATEHVGVRDPVVDV